MLLFGQKVLSLIVIDLAQNLCYYNFSNACVIWLSSLVCVCVCVPLSGNWAIQQSNKKFHSYSKIPHVTITTEFLMTYYWKKVANISQYICIFYYYIKQILFQYLFVLLLLYDHQFLVQILSQHGSRVQLSFLLFNNKILLYFISENNLVNFLKWVIWFTIKLTQSANEKIKVDNNIIIVNNDYKNYQRKKSLYQKKKKKKKKNHLVQVFSEGS